MDYSANPQLSERGKVLKIWGNFPLFGPLSGAINLAPPLLHSRHAPMRAILGRVTKDGEGKLLMPNIHSESAPRHIGFGKCFINPQRGAASKSTRFGA